MRCLVALLLIGILLSAVPVGAQRWNDPDKNPQITHEIVRFNPDGKTALAWGLSNGIKRNFCRWNLTEATMDSFYLYDIFWDYGKRPIALSADGKWVAVATDRDVIRVRALQDKGEGRALDTPRGFTGIRSLAFSPDGKSILATGEQGTRYFDVATGLSREWRDAVSGEVVFSPDGRLVAVPAARVSVYEVATGQLIRRLPQDGTGGIWFNATGRTLLVWAGGTAATVLVEVASGREIWRDDQPEGLQRVPLRLGADGNTVLLRTSAPVRAGMQDEIKSRQGLVELELMTRRELRRCTWEESLPANLVTSLDGKRALSGGDNVVLWDLESGREIRTLSGPFWGESVGGPISYGKYFSMSYSPDGSRAVTVHGDLLIVSDVKAGRALLTCETRPGPRFIFNRYGKTNFDREMCSHKVDWDKGWAYGSYHDGEIVGWRLSDGKLTLKFQANSTHPPNSPNWNSVNLLALSTDGNRLHTQHAVIRDNKRHFVVTQWDLRTQKKVGEHEDSDWLKFLTPEQRLRHEKEVLTLHDANDRKVWAIGMANPPRWFSVVPSSRGEQFAVIGEQVQLFDLKTGQKQTTREFPKVKPGEYWPVALSPDGKFAVGGLVNGRVWLWDFEKETARELVPRGWTGPVTNLAFSADGTRILGAMAGEKLCLWDTVTGKELAHWTLAESDR